MTIYVVVCEKALVAHGYGCPCALCAEAGITGILHSVGLYKKRGGGAWVEVGDVLAGDCGKAHERAYELCRQKGWCIRAVASDCHHCHGNGNVKAPENRCRLRCPECGGSGYETVPPVPADLATKKLQRVMVGEGS